MSVHKLEKLRDACIRLENLGLKSPLDYNFFEWRHHVLAWWNSWLLDVGSRQWANNKTGGGFGLRLKNVSLVEEFGNEQIKSDLR